MPGRRKEIEENAADVVSPALAELGLELVEASYTRRGREQTLCLYLDRPGGITVDELQAASRAVEKVLEVSDLLTGRYRLEVSSPGLDRPWNRLEDFVQNVGGRVRIKLFTPLPDGRRHLQGTVCAVEGEEITVSPDQGPEATVTFDNIARAKPEIDWEQLLKKVDKPAEKRHEKSHIRGGSHEPGTAACH
jgi:ribosome maturation factor RimP